MKHEEKVAVVTGLATGLITGGIAVIVGTPVALATAIWGTYKITTGVYQAEKFKSKS
jgi:ABC-type phosphate transport system permease subunit